ncbi:MULTISPECIES: hypothetical protein [unclassified Thomasclavelia]|uniref:Uncharacterized protein n=1 Tax=Candidatus Erysipelatoclostridium merdavium TaxID=2838566 RepID=A0A9D1XNE7_9FIRM|nr:MULTISPECIES: hypothetical protein [unclassified Thomasclavelia]OUP78306.1 hypothetical protein B5F09_02480 [Erysipelatoclostridium sp. An173]OUQ08750.1 hypothetical protein B5E92_02950 [Erysipelatoclostridium sp. An15]HIX82524.1 hypothetical protein [Candidatus Erysipelatoclostridium merdavium]
MKDIIVNWVKEDEELLEPYEWDEDDDLEIISRLKGYLVDQDTLHDFIYGCINLYEKKYFNRIFIVGDGKYSVVVEINSNGKLSYRSLTMMKQRNLINDYLKKQPLTKFNYHMYDEGLLKEYGLTRNERIKKQYVEHMIDKIYVEDYDRFLKICSQLEINDEKSIGKYLHLKKKLEIGYSFIHELLYNQLVKK